MLHTHLPPARFSRPTIFRHSTHTQFRGSCWCPRLRQRVKRYSSSTQPPADDSSDSKAASDGPSAGHDTYCREQQAKQLPTNYAAITARIQQMDNNQLQTALGIAIAAEDYQLASRIKEELQQKLLASGSAVISKPMDWAALGVPDWLSDRAERLGFMFPTEVQRRATPVILSGSDAVIASETGSGKTAAFLVPALSQLDYPPDLFPDDLEGPQLLLLVPSFELGVQACLLLFKLWGGNISSRTPGDPANMFSYTGPLGIKVRGLLNDEELQMAAGGSYLKGVHAVVATPDMALGLFNLPDSPLSFQDLRVIVVDEMDALLNAYPASFVQLMDAAVQRQTRASTISSVGEADDSGADVLSSPDSSGPEDNLSKLKALLERQQQEREQRLRQKAANDATGSAGDTSLAAAAARLEGLLAAPAAPQAADAQQPATPQQPSDSADTTADRMSSQQQQQQQQQAAMSSSDAAESKSNTDDDSPMAKPQVVLVGATISDSDVRLALSRSWLTEPVSVRVGAAGAVPAGLRHRAIVVRGAQQKLGGLVSSLRKDLSGVLAAADAAAAEPSSGQHVDPVRVIVFAQNEREAQSAAEPLRSALWGAHMLAVLLPTTGAEPIKALHAFRDRVASMLLATPSAARGLDLPAVSHVYSLGLPADANEYVHRAGRAGRIGSTAGGECCTVVTRAELETLRQMVEGELGLNLECNELDQQGVGLLGEDWAAARQGLLDSSAASAATPEELGVQQEQNAAKEQQLETARKGLEDLFNLL